VSKYREDGAAPDGPQLPNAPRTGKPVRTRSAIRRRAARWSRDALSLPPTTAPSDEPRGFCQFRCGSRNGSLAARSVECGARAELLSALNGSVVGLRRASGQAAAGPGRRSSRHAPKLVDATPSDATPQVEVDEAAGARVPGFLDPLADAIDASGREPAASARALGGRGGGGACEPGRVPARREGLRGPAPEPAVAVGSKTGVIFCCRATPPGSLARLRRGRSTRASLERVHHPDELETSPRQRTPGGDRACCWVPHLRTASHGRSSARRCGVRSKRPAGSAADGGPAMVE